MTKYPIVYPILNLAEHFSIENVIKNENVCIAVTVYSSILSWTMSKRLGDRIYVPWIMLLASPPTVSK